jgi:DNA-binding transcriptional regulator YdaS (Cro superfamily)
MDAFDRFRAWLSDTGTSQVAAARALGVSQTLVCQVVGGKKRFGRSASNALERATRRWPPGPIRSEEWDAAELRVSSSVMPSVSRHA